MQTETKTQIIPRNDHPVSRKNISSAAIKVLYRLKDSGHTAYLAGGGVRDLLLGRQPKDFDVVTDATPQRIKKIFRNSRIIGRRFQLVHILFRGEIIETSTFRAPAPAEDENHGKHIFHKKEDGLVLRDNIWGTPEQDALRRDFTVNALFYNIADFSIIDHVGGMQDIRDRIIRVIGNPADRFAEDPVRMIRAVRFAATLDFTIEQSAHQAILENADKIAQASPPRLYEEIRKLFTCGKSAEVFRLLTELGLFRHLFPELGDWLHAENQGTTHWTERCFEQFDRWKQAGLEMHLPLMFALLFGEYHERKAQHLIEGGLDPATALQTATADHLRALNQRILIPKAEAARIAQLMQLQPRFAKTNEKNIRRLLRSPGFSDAFLYFKFACKHMQRDTELLEFWNKRRTRR